MEDTILRQLKEIAIKNNCPKLVFFGSRARGDQSTVSDYDIAFFDQGLSAEQKAAIFSQVEEIETLKKIDVVFVNDQTNEQLMENIRREGVVIYG